MMNKMVILTNDHDEYGGIEIVVGEKVQVLLGCDLDVGSQTDQGSTNYTRIQNISKYYF